MQDPFMNLLARLPERLPAESGTGGRGPGRAAEADAFLDCLRSVVARNATGGNRASPSRRSSGTGRAQRGGNRAERSPLPAAPAKHAPGASLPPHRQEALERLAILAADGSLRQPQWASLSEDEWDGLEAWALAGAGGLFPPTGPAPDAADGLGWAAEGAVDGEAVLARLEQLLAVSGDVSAAAGGSAEAPLLAQLFALDGLHADQREALAQTLVEVLGGAAGVLEGICELLDAEGVGLTAEGDAEPNAEEALAALLRRLSAGTQSGARMSEGLEGTATGGERPAPAALVLEALKERIGALSREELIASLQQAGDRAGVAPLADGARLSALPDAVLRSLAVQVLEGSVSAQTGDGAGLLAALGWDRTLRERLMTQAGTGAQSADLDVSDAQATQRDGLRPQAGSDRGNERNVPPGDRVAAGRDTTPNRKDIEPSAIALDARQGRKGGSAAVGNGEGVSSQAETAGGETFQHEVAPASAGRPLEGETLPAGVAGEIPGAEAGSTPRGEGLGQRSEDGGLTQVQSQAPQAPAESQSQAARAAYLAENIERIEQVMRLSVHRQISRVSVQLSPPELGRVTIRLRMIHGVVSATVQTETADAQSFLASGVQQLRQNLQVQGIDLDSFDVFLGGQEAEQGQDGRWPAAGRKRGGGLVEAGEEGEPDGASLSSPARGVQSLSEDGSLNVIV